MNDDRKQRPFGDPRAARRLVLLALVLAVVVEIGYAGFGEDLLAQVSSSNVLTATGYPLYSCGDRRCTGTENAFTCSRDCRARCGDRICSPGEGATCRSDCDAGGACPNGVCELEESHLLCPQDCAKGCGDQLCEKGEDASTCPTDCSKPTPPQPVCGNEVCETASESPDTCPEDCGTPGFDPPPPPPPPSVCGDGACGAGENPCNCTADCGPVGDPGACACGNGVCSAHESCSTCSRDCGACPQPPGGTCGDAVCEEAKGEFCSNCAADCGYCPAIDDTTPYEPPSDPAQQSDGLDGSFQVHWSASTSSEDFPAELEGDATHEVATPLADAAGRRDVVYRPTGGGAALTLNTVPLSWNFLAGGVKATNGLTAVCWNRFVGAPSGATQGGLPDPRQGVALICRVHDGKDWGPELVIEAGIPAAWLSGFAINGQGEPVVTYQRDSFGTLFNTGKPGDGEYSTTFHR